MKKESKSNFLNYLLEKKFYILILVLIAFGAFIVFSLLNNSAKTTFNPINNVNQKETSNLVHFPNAMEQKAKPLINQLTIDNKTNSLTTEVKDEAIAIEKSTVEIETEKEHSEKNITEESTVNIEPTTETNIEHVVSENHETPILKNTLTNAPITVSICSHDNGSASEDPWLIRHQEKDGHWDAGKHEGKATHEMDCAVTAMALLSILGQGHTDRAGKYKKKVKAAYEWLIANQLLDGSWSSSNYVNGICTMTICEARGMACGGEEVANAANLAVEFLLKEQNASGFFDYSGPSNTDDMSVTGWCIFALKSAILADIKEKEIKKAFLKCGELLDNTNGTKDNTETSEGLAWYLPNIKGSGYPGGSCQAIAMLIRQYIGWERSAPWLIAAADGQASQIPKDYQSLDIYRAFFADRALYQTGGKPWLAWRIQVHKLIIESQRKDGDYKGSWDNNGSPTDIGGRVLNTAILMLSHAYTYYYQSVMK